MKCHECGESVPGGRIALGYRTCLPCGEAQARKVKHTIVPMNKQAYTVVTNRAELAMLNPKRVAD